MLDVAKRNLTCSLYIIEVNHKNSKAYLQFENNRNSNKKTTHTTNTITTIAVCQHFPKTERYVSTYKRRIQWKSIKRKQCQRQLQLQLGDGTTANRIHFARERRRARRGWRVTDGVHCNMPSTMMSRFTCKCRTRNVATCPPAPWQHSHCRSSLTQLGQIQLATPATT